MKNLLQDEKYDFISDENKGFIIAFNDEINKMGYDCGNKIGSGFCWGKYMIIYSKTGAKSKKVIARIYIKDTKIVLRLFFSNIDKHSKYIENAPSHIKEVFTGEKGNCHFHKDKCSFRKTYTIDNRKIDKCSGVVFEFRKPTIDKLPDYIGLLAEFYAKKIK